MMIKENNVDSTFLQIMKDNGLGGLEDIKAIKNITIKFKQKKESTAELILQKNCISFMLM